MGILLGVGALSQQASSGTRSNVSVALCHKSCLDGNVIVSHSAFCFLVLFLWKARFANARQPFLKKAVAMRMLSSRSLISYFFNRISFLLGIPSSVLIIAIPQRCQIVLSATAFRAGIHLLPFTIASPFGLLLGNIIGGATKILPIYVILGSSLLSLLGYVLNCSVAK